MAWPEVSIEDFPPQRDDEPASLRQDILDELTDHFACALNRELLTNSDKQTAKQRVLNQFGDPIKIARQLWLEAMKEKIMSQRIMTGVSLIMAVCCIAVVGLAWILVKDGQGVNQSMIAQLAAIADRPQTDSTVVASLQRTNEEMVRELKNISVRQQSGLATEMSVVDGASSKSEEMKQISFQLVQDNRDKKPAVGFTGKLIKMGADTYSLDVTSDEQGILDFGRLPWANYYLRLSSPWGESHYQLHVNVVPGRDFSETIVCPAAPPKDIPVQFQVNWPDKLKSEDWVLLCDFRASHTSSNLHLDLIGDVIGDEEHRDPFEITQVIQNENWIYRQSIQKGVYLVTNENKVIPCPLSAKGRFVDFEFESLAEQSSINMKVGKYDLPAIYLFHKDDFKQLAKLNLAKSYSVLTPHESIDQLSDMTNVNREGGIFKMHTSKASAPFTVISAPFERVKFKPAISKRLERYGSVAKRLCGIKLPKGMTFTASNAQQNLWEINLPELDFVPIESSLSRGMSRLLLKLSMVSLS